MTSSQDGAGRRLRFLPRIGARNIGLLIALAIWLIFLRFTAPFYFNFDNYRVIGLQIAFIGIGALGTSLLMIGGNIDLSIGSMMAVCATAAALAARDIGVIPAILAGIAVGGAIGLFNGLMVWRFKISPLIITLGMLAVLRGIAVLMTSGYAVTGVPDQFKILGGTRFFGLQSPVWFLFLGFAVVGVYLHRTTTGRHIYAMGSSRDAAQRVGINIRKMTIGLFLVNGLIVGLVGLLAASRLGTANPTFGVGFELEVITAVILGGVAFSGGEGSLGGVLIALVLIGNIRNGIIAVGLDSAWAQVANGALLVVAVAIDQVSQEQREKYRRLLAMRERTSAGEGTAESVSRPEKDR